MAYEKKMVAAVSSQRERRVKFQLCSKDWQGVRRDPVTV